MKLTHLGHVCFLWDMGEKNILFDPFISPTLIVQEIQKKNLVNLTLMEIGETKELI